MAVETYLSKASGVFSADSPPVNKKPNKQRLNRRMKALEEKRQPYIERWMQIRDYQLPYVGEFEQSADKQNPGRRRDLKIAHSVTWRCAQIFAAGVMSGLTPPSRQWFRFVYSDPELNANIEAMKVLDERYEIVNSILARSNFYDSANVVYLELPFGQCPLAIFYDARNGVRFQPQTIGTYYIDVDGFGRVNTFARKIDMTVGQLVDCFGLDALNENMRTMYMSNPNYDKKYTVCWLVEPNADKMPGKIDKLNMPYRSIYWLENSPDDEFLYVGGFEEWAIPVARYLVNGLEPYAKGPGWFAEGDSKMLQLLKKDALTAVELSIKPPMQGPASLANNGGINLVPGGMTTVDDMSQQIVKPLFNVNLAIQDVRQEIAATEEAIKRAYSADLFLMLENVDSSRMTAREVMERTQEKLQQLGPVVERMQNEFLSPTINRVYNILDRAGAFPPIPDELVDIINAQDIRVDYISPLAQAQKMSGLVNIEQGIAQIAQMAQIWPEVTKKIDPINTISKYFEMLGMPAVTQRSDEEIAEMLQAEQEQQAQMQQMAMESQAAQNMAPIADAAKNLTAAANDANPALTSWLGVPGGWD